MKGFVISFVALLGLVFGATTANAEVIGGKRYEKTIYVSAAVDTATKSANNSGRDYASAKGFFDGDLLSMLLRTWETRDCTTGTWTIRAHTRSVA